MQKLIQRPLELDPEAAKDVEVTPGPVDPEPAMDAVGILDKTQHSVLLTPKLLRFAGSEAKRYHTLSEWGLGL